MSKGIRTGSTQDSAATTSRDREQPELTARDGALAESETSGHDITALFLDPRSLDQMEGMARARYLAGGADDWESLDAGTLSLHIDVMTTAVRSLLAPPSFPEPQGDCVARISNGTVWTRADWTDYPGGWTALARDWGPYSLAYFDQDSAATRDAPEGAA